MYKEALLAYETDSFKNKPTPEKDDLAFQLYHRALQHLRTRGQNSWNAEKKMHMLPSTPF